MQGKNWVILALLLVILFLGIILYQSRRALLKSVPFCSARDLTTQVSSDSGAGNVYLTFEITNNSASTCTVKGDSFITVGYDLQKYKNLNVFNAGLPSVDFFNLKPKQTIYALVHYVNGPQCSTGQTAVPITYTYTVSPTTKITFTPPKTITGFSIPSCKSPTDLTDIAVSNFTNISPNQL